MVVTDGDGIVPVERVRCLDCGTAYVKPSRGSTIRRNPGCPRCGYVGWIPAFEPVTVAPEPRRARDHAGRRPPLRSLR